MEKYHGSKQSGISAYKNTPDGIIIKYKDGSVYLYNYIKPGEEDIEQMKILAVQGKGLATYINQNVRDNYFKKLE